MLVQTWAEATTLALSKLWEGFWAFVPNLIGALMVFIIGWVVAQGIGKLAAEILNRIKLNQFFERTSWKTALEKAELKVNPSEFIGAIIKWILMIVFLLAAMEILGLVEFADFLKGILAYLPNVVIAILISVVTVIVVDIVEKIIRATVEGIKVGYGHLVSTIVKWSIWVFAILAILQQLKFEVANWIFELLKIVFIGIVAMAAIAFGLGGKEVAAEILQDLRKKLKE
jgi:small-conductance mechanosensitive channel